MSKSGISISVVVPTYNRAKLVTEAIDSLLSQTRVPDEIIVVDDGSTDDTLTTLQRYPLPVRVIERENGGLAVARNTGLEHATGDLIAFLDDDDTLTPRSIEIRAVFLEQNPSFDVVYGDIRLTDLDGKDLGLYSTTTRITAPSGSVLAAFALRNRRPVHAFMFRREILNKTGVFDPNLRRLEDYHFWLRVAMYGRFQYLPDIMGDYRFHTDQMTHVQQRRMIETEAAVREEFFSTPAFAALLPLQRARAYAIQGTQYSRLGDLNTSRKWYLTAIRTAPAYIRPYLLLALTPLGQQGFDRIFDFYHRLRRKSLPYRR